MLDPHGVAKYVEQYAEWKYTSLNDRVGYKDSMFRLLIGRDPEYYTREINGVWFSRPYDYIQEKGLSISQVVTESDFIFGPRIIWDVSAWDTFFCITITGVIDAVLNAIQIGKVIFFADLIKDARLKNDIFTSTTQRAIDEVVNKVTTKFVRRIYSFVTILANSLVVAYEEAARLPYHEKKVYSYWIDFGKYDIYIKDNNDNTIKLNDIREAFNTEE